jgi:hypothetical protein
MKADRLAALIEWHEERVSAEQLKIAGDTLTSLKELQRLQERADEPDAARWRFLRDTNRTIILRTPSNHSTGSYDECWYYTGDGDMLDRAIDHAMKEQQT